MLSTVLLSVGCVLGAADVAFYEEAFVFDPEASEHGHVHASCIVVCPNGDLRVVWYENGPQLPAPYPSEHRDKSGDVRIGGGRKAKGAQAWDPPFVMTDTFGVSDNNPCMVIDAEDRLWLVYGTLLGVPENTWGSALVRYRVSSDYDEPGPPRWDEANILPVHPHGFEEAITAKYDASGRRIERSPSQQERRLERVRQSLANPLKRRLGWMPRAHPLVRSDGAVVVPLANENYGLAAMAITSDGGGTWTIGNAVPGTGVIQPTLVEWPDGNLSAFFRNGRAVNRVLRSESNDGGLNWGPLSETDLLHPGSGLEAIRLANGHLLVIYNDKIDGPRDKLAVSISDDRGKTWKWTRHLEDTPGGRFDYPSIVQAGDGTLHACYSYNLKTIKYAHFNEAWVMAGD